MSDEVVSRPARAPTIARPSSLAATGAVLVVDDDPTNQRVVVEQLRRLGVAADVAGDGGEALAALARAAQAGRRYGTILMDLDMPGMDGHEAVRAIREAEVAAGALRLPIVALTATFTAGVRDDCERSGMDEVLTKPLTCDALHTVLARWLPNVETTAVHPLAPVRPMPLDQRDAPLDLARLSETFDDDEHRIGVFLRDEAIPDLGAIIGQVGAAIAARDEASASRFAHRLRGAASMIGADVIAVATMTLDVAVLGGNWTSAETSLELLASSLHRIREWLERSVHLAA